MRRFRLLLALLAATAAISLAPASARACDERASAPTDSLSSLIDDLTKVWSPWCGPGSYGQSGWMSRELPAVSDSTASFKARYEAVKAKKDVLPADAKEPVYLVVGGLFTKQYPGYMTDNYRRLKELGLDYVDVPVDTSGSVAKNAEIVRQAIVDASSGGRKVILIGHSKGGVDLTAAIALHPELIPHVRAVVTMQSPYGGTPMASDIGSCHAASWLMNHFIRDVLDGDVKSIGDLSYASRQAFVRAHPYPADRIPTISLGSSRHSYVSTVGWSEWYMWKRYGIANDGMVPTADAEIPGAHVVRMDDLDHAQSTFHHLPADPQHRPGDLTEALIDLALEASR